MKLIEERVTEFVKRVRRRNIRETMVAGALIVVVAYDISQQKEDNLSIIGSTSWCLF